MIIGNEKTKDIIRTYLHDMVEPGKESSPFLLFHGPEHVGKSSFAQEMAAQLVGPFWHSDILLIRDLSQTMGKKHTLKVESDEEIQLEDGTRYEDLGARQMREWMVKSPLGNRKVLILENIERMSDSAANAFLKNFEEPLPGRLIIATTKNKNDVLETILSRALMISFDYVADADVKEVIAARYPDLVPARRDALVDLAAGRPGFVLELLAHDADLIQHLQDSIIRFIAFHERNDGLVEMFRLLTDVQKKGSLDIFLDTLIYHYERQGRYPMLSVLLETKKNLSYPISADNVLFDLALHHHTSL